VAKLLSISCFLVLVALSSGARSRTRQPNRRTTSESSVTMVSPNRRYAVRFADERSDGRGAGKLWGTITVRDLSTGKERTARTAEGERSKGIFEGLSQYDDSDAWSPDGFYLAYRDDYCLDEAGVSAGVICHLHEIHILSMKADPTCRAELVLDRYAFGGWMRGRRHTLLEILINKDGQKVKRLPCARR
jgi:hypothetical protein